MNRYLVIFKIGRQENSQVEYAANADAAIKQCADTWTRDGFRPRSFKAREA